VVPSGVLSVYYNKICLKFASHHFLSYAVYICQKSLNFIYAFKCYQQIAIRLNVSWPHFSWPTLYTVRQKHLFQLTDCATNKTNKTQLLLCNVKSTLPLAC